MVSSASSHGYGSKVRSAHQISARGSRHGKFARASAAAGAGRRGVERSEGHYSARARDSAASTRSTESDAFLVFDNLNQEPTVKLTGRSIVGPQLGATSGKTLHAANPATGEQLEPVFYAASPEEVDRAASLAAAAFADYNRLPGRTKGKFLRRIAEAIEALGEEFISRAVQETALPAPRIKSETARTCFQLRLFAELVEEGSWVGARIDRGDPNRSPLPKPDVRAMSRPLGPVAVFCASNFPIAFSVAGGDTASAFAAGNPVLVKAHAAHLGTAEMVGQAVRDAARDCAIPDGVFSLLFGAGTSVGTALVN